MNRTTIEVYMGTNDFDEVMRIVASKLEPEGFRKVLLDGEVAWVKGDGVIIKLQCIAVVFTGKSVLIQAWVRDALLGESDLEGYVAYFAKKRMKELIKKISTAIACMG